MEKIFGSICILLYVCVLSVACVSTRHASRDELQYQREIDRLEEELRNRDRTIDSAIRELAAITDRSSRMEGTVDDVIELFDEYDRAVRRLLQCYSGEDVATTASD